jgi:hypothetical protein
MRTGYGFFMSCIGLLGLDAERLLCSPRGGIEAALTQGNSAFLMEQPGRWDGSYPGLQPGHDNPCLFVRVVPLAGINNIFTSVFVTPTWSRLLPTPGPWICKKHPMCRDEVT